MSCSWLLNLILIGTQMLVPSPLLYPCLLHSGNVLPILSELKTNTWEWILKVHHVMLFLWHSSVDTDKISLFPNFWVDSEIAFVNYTCFTVSYCCIGHHVGNYYVDIINRHIDQLFRQRNECVRNILHTNIM